MKYIPLIFFFIFILSCSKEKLLPAYPEGDYILELIQSWGKNSEFESLPEKNLNKNNLELRVWSGFNKRGNKGVVLNKTNGNWSAYSIEIRFCEVLSLQPEVSDSLKLLVTIDKEFALEINCNLETMDDVINDYPQFTDSLYVTKLKLNTDIDQLWSTLIDEGLFSLTSAIEPSSSFTLHTYAIEIKMGNVYRAFVTDSEANNESDFKTQKIAEIIDQYLNTKLDYYSW